jgi:hypothetical protein
MLSELTEKVYEGSAISRVLQALSSRSGHERRTRAS